MRIATFNINNVNKRLPNLLGWLASAQPDVVCLQELKCEDRAFPIADIESAGYGAVWQGQRSWNGVAILARGATPVITRRALPGDPADDQARYIEAAVSGVLIASIYLPNGNPQPGPKFAYKLAWFERLIAHAAELMTADIQAVLAGDYNVVPTEADIWPGHHEQANALLQPEARAAYQRLLDQGWTDALRRLQPDGPLWTFWGYLRHRWPNDKGMRLDHLLMSPRIAGKLVAAGVSRSARGEIGASDHAPAWIETQHRRETRKAGRKTLDNKGGRAFFFVENKWNFPFFLCCAPDGDLKSRFGIGTEPVANGDRSAPGSPQRAMNAATAHNPLPRPPQSPEQAGPTQCES